MQHFARDCQLEEALYKEFLFFVPFLIMFVMYVVVDRDVEALYWGTTATGDKIATEEVAPLTEADGPYWAKTFHDIGKAKDFYEYAESVVISNLYGDEVTLTNNMINGNIKVGAMRFRNKRVKSRSCKVNTRWIPKSQSVFSADCYASWTEDHNDPSDWGPDSWPNQFQYQKCNYPSMRHVTGVVRGWDCSGVTFDVPWSLTADDALRQVQKLRNSDEFAGFADPQSVRQVMHNFITYNPAQDVFTLSRNFVEITQGGSYFPNSRTHHFVVWSSNVSRKTVYMFFFMFVVLVKLGWFFRNMIMAKLNGSLS